MKKLLNNPSWLALILVLTVIQTVISSNAYAQFESPDYNPNIWVTDGDVDAIVRSGNTIYIGGTFNFVGPNTGAGAPLSIATGQVQGSQLTINGLVSSSVSDGNGGWYIGGLFDNVGGVSRNNIAHILPDNTLDMNWNPNANAAVRTIFVTGDIVYAGGEFTTIGGETRNRIAALDAITGEATNWNPDANSVVRTIIVNGDIVYAGGEFTTIGGQARNRIAALDATTGEATNWNPNASGEVRTLAIKGNTVYAGGYFTTIGGQARNRLAALDATTGLATNWNPNGSNVVFALAISGNTVYAGGEFTSIGGQTRNRIAALDATTGLATNWDPNVGSSSVFALVVSGNTVYAGGTFTSIGGQTRNRIAALDATTGQVTNWNPHASGTVFSLAVSGNTVYAGGTFITIGGQMRRNIAALDVTTGQATNWNPNASARVRALAISGNILYAGGSFTSIGGQTRNRIAALDATTGQATNWNPNADGIVYSLALNGNTVYAGGWFSGVGGQIRNQIAALDATTGLATNWNPNASGGVVFALATSGNMVYVGGSFTNIGGQAKNCFVALDATTGLANNWNLDASGGVVFALATSGNMVFVGGAFNSIGGQTRNRLAALDVTTGLLTNWNPNSLGTVLDIAVSENTVYAGGSFTTIGGQTRDKIAALDATTGLVTNWDPNANVGLSSGEVRSIALAGNTVYLGGTFTSIGGVIKRRIAALSGVQCILPGTITISANSPTTFCSGGSVTLGGPVIGSGESYLWSNGATTQNIEVTASGTYNLRVVAGTCTSQVSNDIVVTVNPTPTTPTISANSPTTFCAGGSVTLQGPVIGSGETYFWSNGATSQDISVTTSGSYSLQVVAGTCTSQVSNDIVVTVNPTPTTPTITAAGPTTFCVGGSVTLQGPAIGGGQIYLWSNGATTQNINVSTSGSYTLRVVSGACTSAVSNAIDVTINAIPSTPTITAAGPTAFCNGGSVILQGPAISGGQTYLWQNGETTQNITVTVGGTYNLRIVAGTCTSSVSNGIFVDVSFPPATPTISAAGPTTFCSGASVILQGPAISGGQTYLWSNGATTQNINVTTSGSYSLQVVAGTCTSAVSNAIAVTVNPTPSTPSISAGGPVSFCSGGSVMLNGPAIGGGETYLWSNGATTQNIEATATGTFSLRVVAGTCTSSVSNGIFVDVSFPPATPTITAAGPTTFCSGASVILQGPAISGGQTYLWSNGATTQNINVTTSGSYSLQVVAGTCTSAVSNAIAVTVNPTPSTPSISAGGPVSFCSGGSVMLNGPTIGGGETYLWSNGATTQNIEATATGTFSLKVVAGTCTSQVSNSISVAVNSTPSTPTISADGATDFCLGNSVNLQGPSISGGQSYLWSNGATTQNINVTQSGSFNLQIVAGTCTSSVSNSIVINVDNACPGNFIWNGTGSWTSAANWTPAFVPTPNSNITVQSGTLTVNGNYAINNLTVNGGSNLFIGGGSVLNIAGNAIVNGGSNANGGGEINLNGTGNQLLSSAGAGAWNIGTLRVSNNSGTVTLNRQLLIWRELILGNGSIFDLNGRSLTLKANATSRVTANLNMIAGNAQLLNTSGFWCEVAYPKSPAGSGGSWVQTTPPVQGQQVRALQQKGNFPSIESYNAAIPASGSLYWFSNSFTTHPTNNGFYKPSDSTEAWPLGKGIRAWIRKVPADNGAFGYKGAPFTGNSFVINNLDYCTNNCAIVDPNGLNLVGNPLAATIDWNLLIRNHVEDAMYQYNHSQLIYATYIDGVGVNGGRKEIATGQGFFVHALQAGASITVPQTAVVPASTFAIFRSGAIEDLLRININLGDSSVDEMAIRLKDGATHNFDSRYDGRKMTGSGINIASIAEDGRRLSVDARPLSTGMIRIPLVMSAMNNLRNEELVFTGIESFGTKKVYLNHPSFDAPVQLTEGQRFTVSPAYATGLEVIINNSPQALEGQLSNTFSLYPNPATENLTVSGINSGTVVSVLTVQGKEIIRQTLGAEGSLSVKALPQGLYFVEINGIKKTFVKQ